MWPSSGDQAHNGRTQIKRQLAPGSRKSWFSLQQHKMARWANEQTIGREEEEKTKTNSLRGKAENEARNS